jgi:Polyketide cyclase / dehydrase and lipid transport
MAAIRVVAEGNVGAPAERVYGILADYRQHHPKILPPAFSDFRVDEGGVGAGTVIRFRLKAGGRTEDYRAVVSEPEPGRVLREDYPERSSATNFMVTPAGDACRVRIETTGQRAGLRGVIERLLAPRVLAPLYADELARLDRYAREQG